MTFHLFGCFQRIARFVMVRRNSNCPVAEWLKSGQYAKFNGIELVPMEHPVLKNIPLSVQKGQAESFCLKGKDGSRWILKKFFQAKSLSRKYLNSVTKVLPGDEAFIAGTKRIVLSSSKLSKGSNFFYSTNLSKFASGAILMPRIIGTDWAGIADDIRSGKLKLSTSDRGRISLNLAETVNSLEKRNCSHRDLSSGNVFIDPSTWKVYLIDFDSMYHPSLEMPKGTTCGTDGYIPKYAWWAGDLASDSSWCRFSDRFSLGLLISEFLVIGKKSPLTSEGGIFDQSELKRGTGPGIDRISLMLKKACPSVHNLLMKTIQSSNYSSCPSPSDWIKALSSIGSSVHLPKLNDIPVFAMNTSQIIRVPRLSDIPEFKPGITITVHF